jgi:DNA mismatch repair ATPase MutS
LSRDERNFGKWKLQRVDLSQYMHLDAAAVRALHLLPQPGDRTSSSSSSLL